MKPFLKVISLGLALTMGGLAAQPSAVPDSAGATDAPAPPSLSKTMMLALQGQVKEIDAPIDLSLAISGPGFSTSVSFKNSEDAANPLSLNLSGTVEQKGEKYLVTYALSWRVPRDVPIGALGQRAVSYRSYGLQNSAYLQVDKPIVLLDEQGKKLTLAIKNNDVKKAPASNPPSA